jgi:serine protease Do
VRRGDETLSLAVDRAKPGYLGVSPGPLDEDRRAALALAPEEGMLLRQVTADGPAAKGGLKAGDVLIRIAGRPVGAQDLGRRLAQIGAGETVEVTIIRDGERLTLPVTLGERPSRR